MSHLFSLLLMVAMLRVSVGAQASAPAPEQMLTRSQPEPALFGTAKFGMLSVAPTLRLSEIGIDSNIISLDGSKRLAPDFMATLVPGVDVRLDSNRFDVALIGNAGLVFYSKHSVERSINPSARIEAGYRVSSRVQIVTEGAGGYSRERRSFEIDARPRQTSHGASVGARYLGRRLSLESTLSTATNAYSAQARYLGVNLSETLDKTQRAANVTASYRLTPYTTFRLGASASTARFRLTPIRDVDSNRAYVEASLHPRALLAGNLRVGYIVAKTLDDGAPDFVGLTAQGGISHTWRDAFSAAVGVERDFDHSFRTEAPYYTYLLYEGSIRQVLFNRFDIGGSVSRTTLTYRMFAGFPQLPQEVIESVAGSFGIRVARQSRVGLFVDRWRRRYGSTPYDGYRAALQITLGRINLNERGVFLHGAAR